MGADFQHRNRCGWALGTGGGVVAGPGLGDARRAVGLEIAVASLSTYRSGAFYRPAVGVKAHRALTGATTVAIGVENVAVLRGGKPEGAESWYAVATRVFTTHEHDADPAGSFAVSMGIGSGRFRAEEDVVAGRETVNVFASMGVRLAGPVSAIAEWSGQDVTLAASVVPVRCLPLVVTSGLTDVTGRAGNGARLIVGMGAAFRFADVARMEVPRCF